MDQTPKYELGTQVITPKNMTATIIGIIQSFSTTDGYLVRYDNGDTEQLPEHTLKPATYQHLI